MTAQEVAAVAEQMSDNHQSMRALVSIAKKSGVDLHVSFPSDDFNEAMDQAQAYYMAMIEAVNADEKALNFRQIEFYNYHNTGMANFFSEMLDQCLFSAPQMHKETPLDRLIKEMDACKGSNPEKAERIRRFINTNETRLMSEDERMTRDIELLLKET